MPCRGGCWRAPCRLPRRGWGLRNRNALAGGQPPLLLGQCCLLGPGRFGQESLRKHPAELCLLAAAQRRGGSALDFLASSFSPGYGCAPSPPIGLFISDTFGQAEGI